MNKKFDCVKMKHEIQKKLYEEFKPISTDDYFDKLIKYSHKTKLFSKLKWGARASAGKN